MRKILMAAMLVASGQGAFAADMPDYALRGGYNDTNFPRPNWEGFYVGGQAAQGWTQIKPATGYNADIMASYALRTGNVPPVGDLPRAEGRKAAYGGFVGYNTQWEDVVVGVEASYLHSDVSATSIANSPANLSPIQARSSATLALKDFGSLRLRGGYMVYNFLPYAFVGFTAGSADVTRSAGISTDASGPVAAPFETVQKNLFTYGYSAGVGLDVMLVGGLFARAEYEYAQYTSKVNTSVNTVRVGLGYKF